MDVVMVTGWKTIGNKKDYFMPEDGKAARGWMEIGGKRYYFWMSSAQMSVGWNILGNDKYYHDANGVMQTGTITIDGKQYTFDTNGKLIE